MPQAEVKRDPRIVRSMTAMRSALLQLMSRKPFAAITITEIVGLAGYNRGTFYANYTTKEDLLEDMIGEKINDLLQSFRAPYAQVSEFSPHELHANSVMIFNHIARNADFYTILTKSDVLPALRKKMFASLKNILTEELSFEEGDVDQELMFIYSLNALLGLIFYWIESGYAHPPAYMQEQLVKILNHMPSPGKKLGVRTQAVSKNLDEKRG
ncbi:TetR/AcrR family transcriptional regulator [Paenibacillus apis]|uniref:TetR family transcriptional regulator n=1 Tax=Paenibacillus apis TaxID=1792174 RepID=A0A919Y2I4_9BACL|nr:TetR/AcrR family transcriptional regulator [Paenibacillus apis]GIO41118.1 TetR family transcriptional regulator [Paenibacillus apis]